MSYIDADSAAANDCDRAGGDLTRKLQIGGQYLWVSENVWQMGARNRNLARRYACGYDDGVERGQLGGRSYGTVGSDVDTETRKFAFEVVVAVPAKSSLPGICAAIQNCPPIRCSASNRVTR